MLDIPENINHQLIAKLIENIKDLLGCWVCLMATRGLTLPLSELPSFARQDHTHTSYHEPLLLIHR